MSAAEGPQADGDVSALVVAIEKYASPDYGTDDIAGSAQLAARFVDWLVTAKVCRPERITFMVSYDEGRYPDGSGDAVISLKELLRKFRTDEAFTGIQVWEHASSEIDFIKWIGGQPHGPRRLPGRSGHQNRSVETKPLDCCADAD